MKIYNKLLTILVLGIVITTLAGCSSNSDEEAVKIQTATVERGDLSLEITAAGNLALSKTEDLAVALSPLYTGGTKATVGEVLVSVGDFVKEGQLLVTMDKSEWADQLTSLEDALTTAQRNVTKKQRALATAQRTVTTKENAVLAAQHQVIEKELAVADAELGITSANITLYKINEVKKIQDEIDMLNSVIEYARLEIGASTNIGEYNYWLSIIAQARAELREAEAELADLLNGASPLTSAEVALQIAQAQQGIKKAEMALEDAQIAVENAKQAVTDAQQAVADAQLDVEDAQTDLQDANQTLAKAQKTLDDAKTVSPEIVAPFDGFITAVNVIGGDEVLNGTVVAQIAAPNKFEVQILVSEMDILNVAIGVNGTMTADAIPDVSFPVTVDWISPTATISSSVVNYPVTVEVTSLKAVTPTQTSTLPTLSGNFTPPAGFNPSGNFTHRDGFLRSDNSTLSQILATSANTTTAKEYTLKSGMTVTVTLTIPLSTNVLLVPSSAITTLNNMSFVEVMTSNGTIERRIITIGNTDYTYTEVKSGLNEGDKVVISSTGTTTTTTTSTSPSSNRRNEFIIPGIGGEPGG